MPQQFDPSKPFEAIGGFDPSKPFDVAPPSTVSVVSPTETDNPIEARGRGFKEGVQGGFKGFTEGMLHSPESFVKGIVSLLTTNPVTTVKDAVAAIERLPDAIRQAGNDPEAWGKGVGDITGQTMIGIAGPRLVKAGAQGVANATQAVIDAPMTARVAPKLVKYGTTVAGGAVGGWPGAILGREVGADLAETMKSRMTAPKPPPVTPAAQILIEGLSSGEPIPASKFMELLRQVPPDQRAAILEARQAAVQGGTAPTPKPPIVARPVQAPPEANPAPATETPVASPSMPQTAPAAAPAASVAKNPDAALRQARATFDAAKEAPRPGELNRAMNFILWGKSPEDALTAVIAQRGGAAAAVDPAAELLKRGIGVSDAEMNEVMRQRALSGTKSLMKKYGGSD